MAGPPKNVNPVFGHMIHQMRGRPTKPYPDRIQMPIELWNGDRKAGVRDHVAIGSQNHPVHGSAAMGQWDRLAKLAGAEAKKGLGIWGRELGSNKGYYSCGPLAAMLAAFAQSPGSENLKTNLRLKWALLALCSLPVFVTRTEDHVWAGSGKQVRTFEASKSLPGSLAVALPGMRWAWDVKSFRANPRGEALAWALAWPEVRPSGRNRVWDGRTWKPKPWWMDVMAEAVRQPDQMHLQWGARTPFKPWGFRTGQERWQLQQVVRNEMIALPTVLSWFNAPGVTPLMRIFRQGNPVEQGARLHIRRTSDDRDGGVECAWTGAAVSGNNYTGRQLCQVTYRGLYRSATAAVKRESGAHRGGWKTEARGKKWHLEAKDGGQFELPMLPGKVVAEVIVDWKGAREV